MANMVVNIEFSTNAKIVRQQIAALNSQVHAAQASTARLSGALDAGKANSRALTGDIRARQSIVKLDKQINALAEQRMRQAVGTAKFGAQDQFVRGLIKSNEQMRIQRKILDDNAKAWVNMGKNTQWAGRQLVVGFTVPLTIAAGAAMKAYADLEKQLVKFKRVYGDINTTAQQTDDMAKSVNKLATEWVKYGVAVSDTIGLAAEAAGAGFKGDALLAQVQQSSKLAVLGQLEQQKAMQATIALQSTFKMSNEELAKSINFLNQLENQTMVTMDDMTTAIPKAGAIIQGLGGDVEDLGVMMAALREGGVSAAEGANALKSGLGSLLNPSKAAAKKLSEVGVNLPKLWEQSEKSGEGVLFVVKELSKAMDTLGSTEKQRAMEELFGKHQFARMNALLQNINKGTQARQAKDVAATSPLEQALVAQQELDKLSSSSLTKFQQSVQQLKAAIAPLGKIIMDVVTPIIKWVADLAGKFNNLPDVVKHISLAFLGLAGVVAPLFLMLIGQMQNLIGNGLKVINFIRNWGKDTKWVAQENITLTNSISKVNSQLIAENKILQKNIALWEQRRAAAGASGQPFNQPRPTPARPRPRGFATGGSVGGKGNGDTVPALLTPGEFVVNKKAAKANAGVLNAMNNGSMQGFALGGIAAKVLSLGMLKGRGKSKTPLSTVEERDIKQRLAEEKIANKNQAELKNLKKKSELKLMGFKGREMSAINRILNTVGGALNATTSQMAKLYPFTQWDQSHINPADTNKLKGMSNAQIAQLQDAGLLGKTAKPRTGPRGPLNQNTKFWDYSGNIIMDNHAINDLGVPATGYHPLTVNDIRSTAGHLRKQYEETGKPKYLIAEEIAKWRATNAGSAFYRDLLDDNFIFMNLHGKSRKSQQYQEQARKTKLNAGKLSTKEFNARYMATGGFVPGTGNKDTVPAMLTPGEAVVKKSAAQKFGGILDAMNSGKLKMFAGGTSGKGWRKQWTGEERSQIPQIEQEISGSMQEWENSIDDIVKNYRKIEQMTDQQAAQLKQQLKESYKREKGQVAHLARERDPVTGQSIYRRSNAVVTPKIENNAMEQLSRKQNLRALKGETQGRAEAAALKAAQKAGRQTATDEEIAREKKKYLQVIKRIENGEHIVDRAQRKYAAQLIASAGRAQTLTPKTQANYQQIAAGLGGRRDLTTMAGKQATSQEVDRQTAAIVARGNVTGMPGRNERGGSATPTPSAGRRGFDPMTLMFALSMFSSTLAGVTDQLGAFGKALMFAMPMLMMFGGSIPRGGGMAGIRGRGSTGGVPIPGLGASPGTYGPGRLQAAGQNAKYAVTKSYAKYGMGAGLAYGTAGIMAGMGANKLIGDDKGGGRDVAGAAAQYGLTGAGIGMMFGPWGAAIGAATGALAGFTIQVLANKKAHEKAIEASKQTATKWNDITKSLSKTYGLGSGKSFEDIFNKLDVGGSEGAKELYEQLSQNELGPDGAFTKRIEELKQQQGLGLYRGPQPELEMIAMQQRAEGTSEEDIDIIAKAFLQALPENMRGGLIPATYSAMGNQDIVAKLDELNTIFKENSGRITVKEAVTTSTANASGYGTTDTTSIMDVQKAKLDPQAVINATNLSVEAIKSLTAQSINAADAMATNAKGTRAYNDAARDYAATQKALADVTAKSADVQKSAIAAGRGEEFFSTLGTTINQMVKSGKGEGLKEGDWAEMLRTTVPENAAELTASAQSLLFAGMSLQDAAGNLISAGQIEQMGQVLQLQQTATSELGAIRGRRAEIKRGYGLVDAEKKARAEAKAQKDAEDKSGKTGADKALEAAQSKEDARQNKWAKVNRGWAIKNASLDISRIHLEERALKDFVGKFNRAFGTSIDSFADAQYQIEKIGLAIRNIQVKTIAPLQEKADDLRRVNELRSRKVDELQKKEQERVDAINKSYDEQAQVLERIRQEQEFIANEAAAAAELTGAFATGNITDITKASINLSRTVSAYGQQQQGRGLEAGREAQLANSPYKAEIDKITKEIEATEKSILAIEDQIYQINEKQIEPMQRRSDLMSLMLDTTKSTLEYQKANIKGIDQENLARKEALKNAREALDNAKHSLDLAKKQRDAAEAQKRAEAATNTSLSDRIKILQEITGSKSTDLKTLEGLLDGMDTKQKAAEERAIEKIGTLQKAMIDIRENGIASVDAWGQPIPRGSTIATHAQMLAYIRDNKVPKDSEYAPPKGSGAAGPNGVNKADPQNRATGGTIPGSGGQDSVPTWLTPGEFVMRKSAVDKIGVANLKRLNTGPDTAAAKNYVRGKDDGLFRGGLKRAAGGEIPNKYYGKVEEGVNKKYEKDPKVIAGLAKLADAMSVTTGGGGGEAGPDVPTGPIPGLKTPKPGSSGYPAENARQIRAPGGARARRIMRYVKAAFPSGITATTYGAGDSDHAGGRAVDYGIHNWSSGAGKARGTRLAHWARKWDKPLGIHYAIWRDRIWNTKRDGEGWRPFVYSGVKAGRVSPNASNRHLNHVHISNFKKGGLVPGAGGADSIPSMLTPGEFVVKKNIVDRVGHLPLKKLNAGAQLSPVGNDNADAGGMMAVYNDYSLVFNVNEQIDSRDMARVVMREIQRVTNSQVKQRT